MERELCANFGPLEAHSGIENGRCEEFDLAESYLSMQVDNLSNHGTDNSAMENESTVQMQTNNQALENALGDAVMPTTDNQSMETRGTETTIEAGSDALQQHCPPIMSTHSHLHLDVGSDILHKL